MSKLRAPQSSVAPPAAESAGPASTGGLGNSDLLALGGGGGALPYRAEMEAAFGTDFSDVRVLTGLGERMRGRGANALTDGTTIAFADPNPSRETVAHELAHVVQHRGGSGTGTSTPGDASEQDAAAAATAVTSGQSPSVNADAGAAVHGDWLDNLGNWAGDRLGDAFDSRTDEARLDAEEDLEDFMGEDYATEHFHPSTGRGNFDAAYDPRAGNLTIHVGVHFDFRDGSPTDPDWVANRTAAGQPADQFAWTEDEKTQYAANAIGEVRQAWEGRYTFHTTKPYWEALPNVSVQIDVVQVDDADAAHYNVEIFKWPEAVLGAHIDVPGVESDHSHNSTDPDHVGGEFHESGQDGSVADPNVSHFVRDTSTRGRYGDANRDNPGTVLFDDGSSDVSATDRTAIGTFATTMGRDDMPPFDLSVTGHTNTVGSDADNQRLSDDRARNVSNLIVTGGAKKQPTVRGEGETGADATPAWRRVDIVVGEFRSDQSTVVHEFGHIFGLGDEYPSADGGSREVGTEVAHSDLAEEFDLTDTPVVAHHSESIMSNGEVVEPHHYATFMEVLGEMTDTRGQWAIGPGSGPRMGPGDFPVPAPGGTTGIA